VRFSRTSFGQCVFLRFRGVRARKSRASPVERTESITGRMHPSPVKASKYYGAAPARPRPLRPRADSHRVGGQNTQSFRRHQFADGRWERWAAFAWNDHETAFWAVRPGWRRGRGRRPSPGRGGGGRGVRRPFAATRIWCFVWGVASRLVRAVTVASTGGGGGGPRISVRARGLREGEGNGAQDSQRRQNGSAMLPISRWALPPWIALSRALQISR